MDCIEYICVEANVTASESTSASLIANLLKYLLTLNGIITLFRIFIRKVFFQQIKSTIFSKSLFVNKWKRQAIEKTLDIQ